MLKLYLEAWENQDLDSVMTFLDEDYINMFNYSIYANKEQCQKMFKNVFATYTFEDMEQKSLEIVIDQNYSFKTWLLKQTWTTNDKKDTTYFDMRGITVFKKQEDGSWKLFREIGQD